MHAWNNIYGLDLLVQSRKSAIESERLGSIPAGSPNIPFFPHPRLMEMAQRIKIKPLVYAIACLGITISGTLLGAQLKTERQTYQVSSPQTILLSLYLARTLGQQCTQRGKFS